MTTACPRAPWDKKNRENKQQNDPRDEDNKERQHKLRMNIQNALYFGLKLKRNLE